MAQTLLQDLGHAGWPPEEEYIPLQGVFIVQQQTGSPKRARLPTRRTRNGTGTLSFYTRFTHIPNYLHLIRPSKASMQSGDVPACLVHYRPATVVHVQP